MRTPLDRVEEIFSEAIELPARERFRFLHQVCGGNDELRREIEALLASADADAPILDSPVNLRPDALLVDEPDEEVGAGIGPYTILGRIGEGGAGVVYEAQQEAPVRRRVALKLLKRGTDTVEAIHRFAAERQMLALMEHPGIARVFDAGATEGGRLYFAMELVRGERITAYCDAHRLPVEARLGLFTTVCRAVQHAHQKGIIHRDLKPSNVLVTVVDGTPGAKVIDFGIAKAVRAPGDAGLEVTRQDQILGTPAYMSPEQVLGRELDTRSDIYSLGVILYELLTGVAPFATEDLLRDGIDGARARIAEQEPANPSERLREMGTAQRTRAACNRDTTIPRLSRSLAGDLDAIARKALEKEPQRRYSSASELAEDIARHLTGRTVEARPAGWGYRIGKYVRRHRFGVAAAASVVLALILGMTAAFIGYRRALAAQRDAESARATEAKARREAESQRRSALAALQASEAVTSFLSDMLAAADPARSGRDVTVREVIDAASNHLEHELSDQPVTHARLQSTMGRTYLALGLKRQGAALLETASADQTKLLGRASEATLETLTYYAYALTSTNRAAAAERVAREVVAAYAGHPEYRLQHRAQALGALADSLNLQWRLPEALEVARKRVALLRTTADLDPVEVLRAETQVATLLWTMGCLPEAKATFDRILADPGWKRDSPERRTAVQYASVVETWLENYAAGERLSREAYEIARAILGPDNPSTLLAQSMVGDAIAAQGRTKEALEWLEPSVAGQRRVSGDQHAFTLTSMGRMVAPLTRAGRVDEAILLGFEASDGLRKRLKDDALVAPALADALTTAGRAAEAEAICRRTLSDLGQQTWRHEYHISATKLALGRALAAQARLAEAEAVLIENHARLAALPFDVSRPLQHTVDALTALYERKGRGAEAARWRGRQAMDN